MPETFLKRTYGRPAEWEQAGLAWLAEAEAAGGAEVVRVIARSDDGLTENHVSSVAPSARFAAEFGQRLAATHTLATRMWGEGPAGWSGPGYQGPNDHLLELSLTPHESLSGTCSRCICRLFVALGEVPVASNAADGGDSATRVTAMTKSRQACSTSGWWLIVAVTVARSPGWDAIR